MAPQNLPSRDGGRTEILDGSGDVEIGQMPIT